jgi:hypothetical protein
MVCSVAISICGTCFCGLTVLLLSSFYYHSSIHSGLRNQCVYKLADYDILHKIMKRGNKQLQCACMRVCVCVCLYKRETNEDAEVEINIVWEMIIEYQNVCQRESVLL